MSSIETTELKLKTSPTGGIEAAHSPYYRRLLSAGYKGYLQGSIGGGALYGLFGLAIGGIIAGSLFLGGMVAGATALTLLPVATALGAFKGATTFGTIGSTAAINAEGAELAEQRRYLLDRYYDLPEGPAGDREAEAIRNELYKRQVDSEVKPPFFHWKTVAIGAAIGAVIALAVFSPVGIGLLGADHVGVIATHLGLDALFSGGALTAVGTAFGAAVGALTGATIGIDRYYVRKWLDHTEGVVHSSSHSETALLARQHEVDLLKEAHREDLKTIRRPPDGPHLSQAADTPAEATVNPNTPVASLDKPQTKIQASDATLKARVAALQEVGIPAI